MDAYQHKLFEFCYVLYGDHALFTNPLTKMSGSKFSYQVPTYQALEGITSNIYWKPSIKPVISSVEVLNQIDYQIENTRLRPADGSSQLGQNMLLKDVRYVVQGFYIPAPDLAMANQLEEDSLNARKHQNMFERALSKGGRKPIFLGASDYVGYVEPYVGNEKRYYEDTGDIPMGTMFYRFDYPNCFNPEEFINRYFINIVMKEGKIEFPLVKAYAHDDEIPSQVFVEKIKVDECNFSMGEWYKNKMEDK